MLYRQLLEINRRPACFAEYTVPSLWTNEHRSAAMLAFHLDPTRDVASRTPEFIDRSVSWFVAQFDLQPGKSVADFGCGPGLYTSRLAATGAAVTGIDFSARSLGYARDQARQQGLAIEYVRADYLEFDSPQRYDLITMIMCDYCALSPGQRGSLLDKFRAHLKDGGAVLLDAYSLPAFAAREEAAIYAPQLQDGFWSPAPYFGFLNTFKYEAEKVVLDKFTIVEETRTEVVYNWLQYFDPASLKSEIESHGLAVEQIVGDVAGAPYDPAGREFAVIARKPAAAPTPAQSPPGSCP